MSKTEKRFWTTVALDKKQAHFLDNTSKNARFTGGRKLSKTAIIRTLIRVAKRLDVNANEVKSEEQLEKRFLAAFEKYK